MRYRILNERTGVAIADHAVLADKPWSRMKGLLGRKGLAKGEAIVLRPASSIHTAFMRFSLDVIFLSRSGEVLKLTRDLKPYRLSSRVGARDVIEFEAGALDGVDLVEGDRLSLVPADA